MLRRFRTGRLLTAGVLALATTALAGSTGLAGAAPGAPVPAGSPPASDYFSTVDIDNRATVGAPPVGDNENHGDLWPNCWAGDDNVYTAYGDGLGFDDSYHDIGVAKISGMPGSLNGEQLAEGDDVGKVWNDGHSRKPTGMACVDGTLYLAVQDLASDFNSAPSATVAKSTDKGRTWTYDKNAPMFDKGAFSTVMFLDYGKDYADAPDDYVYAYGLDHNWRDSFNDRVPDPVDVYLARVPKDSVQNEDAWQYVSGYDDAGQPSWSGDIGDREAVLHDDRHIYQDVFTADRVENTTVLGQGGIVYNKALKRYLYTSWTEYTFEFYEAPSPWGPWKHFKTKDFGGYPWNTADKHGGYATTIPSKYISADGKSMWLQSNVCPCGGGIPEEDFSAYTYSLRAMHLEPYAKTGPGNGPDPDRNLAREPGTSPVERATHHGRTGSYNDGDRQGSEDDWNDERKTASWWGYEWPRAYTMDTVAYTTGAMYDDGGWFDDLRVQVRKDHKWVDVTGLRISPDYPADGTAGPGKTYELTFDATEGDGVRVIGAPGGTRTFTSVAELEVAYAGR